MITRSHVVPVVAHQCHSSQSKRDERDSFGYFVAQIMEKKTYDKTKKERVT